MPPQSVSVSPKTNLQQPKFFVDTKFFCVTMANGKRILPRLRKRRWGSRLKPARRCQRRRGENCLPPGKHGRVGRESSTPRLPIGAFFHHGTRLIVRKTCLCRFPPDVFGLGGFDWIPSRSHTLAVRQRRVEFGSSAARGGNAVSGHVHAGAGSALECRARARRQESCKYANNCGKSSQPFCIRKSQPTRGTHSSTPRDLIQFFATLRLHLMICRSRRFAASGART